MKRLKLFRTASDFLSKLFGFNVDKIDTITPVFKTQNIKRITLFFRPVNMEGVEVPREHMDEITAWIGSFTVGEKAKDFVCGQNTRSFRIEYADGTVVTNGTDTITINGVIYKMKKAPTPECFFALLSANRSAEQ